MLRPSRTLAALSTRHPRRRGFTLIELLVVISIIAFLMGLLSFVLVNYMKTARIRAAHGTIDKIALALQQYYSDCGRVYPPDTGYGLPMTGTFAGVTYDPGSLWRYLTKPLTYRVNPTDPGTTVGPYLTLGERELAAYNDPINGASFYVVDPWRRPIGFVGDPRRVIHNRGGVDLFSAGEDGKTGCDRGANANLAYNNLDDDSDGVIDDAPELGDARFNGALSDINKCNTNERPDDINNWDVTR